MFNCGQRGKRTDLDTAVRLPNLLEVGDMPDVEHEPRLKKLLSHGGYQVRAAGQDANVVGMLGQESSRFFQRMRPQQA